ncbi:MAG: MarR family winged helix-turn-helix transcriptional regulator [Candidatus Sericytochromatia bacterium]
MSASFSAEPSDTASEQTQAASALFWLGRHFARLPRPAGPAALSSCIAVVQSVAEAPAAPVTVGDVARRLGIEPSTASRLVAQTVQQGYLARLASPHDGRAVGLELTPTGQELRAQAEAHQRAVYQRLTSHWSASEQASFARLFVDFSQRLGDMLTQPDGPLP